MGKRTETQATQQRYDRLAPLYDAMEVVVERAAFSQWRRRLWASVGGKRVLEVGVGTGKNLPYHPDGSQVTAIDLSRRMMAQAQQRAHRARLATQLIQADAQHLPFATAAFDAAVATFVFCSVPDAVQGLGEAKRVVRRGGQVLLLEHVRVNAPLIGPLMDLLDPISARLMGPHIARRTAENVAKAGLSIEKVEELAPGALVKLIHARVV
jgi:ubiquinone/menaquinone biosynthesis C-methylase UbiE